MLRDSAAVFTVRDIAAALAWYRDSLGFTVTFQWGEPLNYVCLCRDKVNLHLRTVGIGRVEPGMSCLCLFVSDVDADHAELTGRGVVATAPEDRAYGMRDFDVLDADGNRLIYGMAIGTAKE
jgi:catechol 2,3-dioxygenase-like lactoylglutathione lyase family enzyme